MAQKRKRVSEPAGGTYSNPITIADDTHLAGPERSPKKPKKDEEKRLRRFRPQPPQSFQAIYHRATTQRFYVLSRNRTGPPDCPSETIELAGSTGNVYTVTIGCLPTCDCPHARGGAQCKHVVYVLARVLRARADLIYQLALLSGELCEIFENAPLLVGEGAGEGKGEGEGDGRRKPLDGDCPICFDELGEGSGGAIVWCKAACGQNIHKRCFEMWAATKRRQGSGGVGAGSEVTCPFCRTVWQGDEDMVKKIRTDGERNWEGYVNVADQLGISPVRDTSTYSEWWSGHRRRNYFGYGRDNRRW